MTSNAEQTTTLFAGLPRRHGLAAVPVLLLCLALGTAFAFEVMPLESPQDRFYELEAQRDFFVRAAAARQRALLADESRIARRDRAAVHARTPAPSATRIGARTLAAPAGCTQAL